MGRRRKREGREGKREEWGGEGGNREEGKNKPAEVEMRFLICQDKMSNFGWIFPGFGWTSSVDPNNNERH